MRLFLLPIFLLSWLGAEVLTANILPSSDTRFMQIRILDQKHLSFKKIEGLKFSEISDLAYDRQKRKLFMVSDEGKLFTFEADFSNKIDRLDPLASAKLRKKSGKKFKKWQRDSEGLSLDSKGGMLISFEGEPPKLGKFGYDGKRVKWYRLPKPLSESKNYRSKNKSLEAVALHPKYGILVVAEWPIKKDHKKYQTIYSLSGREWHFKAEPEARSATTAIEVMRDGNLLVMERSFTDIFSPFIVTLKKVYLDNCQNRVCKSEILAKMSSHKGWNSIDNFEGLTRIEGDRYLMVSDDNDNFFQRTLLIYFEVVR